MRHTFWRRILGELNQYTNYPLRTGSVLPAARVWETCTLGVNQFSYRTYYRRGCGKYGEQWTEGSIPGRFTGALNKTIVLNAIDPRFLRDLKPKWGTTNYGAIASMGFGSTPHNAYRKIELKDCRNRCKGTVSRQRVVIGGPSPRLAVLTDGSYQGIFGITSDRALIDYSSPIGITRRVNFRWSGGIYEAEGHFRIYWTGCEIGDKSEILKVYDGKRLRGALIGCVPPDHPEERVPSYWLNNAWVIFSYDLVNDGGDKPTKVVSGIMNDLPNMSSDPLYGTESPGHLSRLGVDLHNAEALEEELGI